MHGLVTIGVYGFTAGAFLDTLAGADVGLLLDLRQRAEASGVRTMPGRTRCAYNARSPMRASATGT